MPRPRKIHRLAPDHPHLHTLNDIISSRALSCASGIFNFLRPGDLVLYYGKEGHNTRLGRIDFSDHTDDELKRLADCCEPAGFGRGEQDVLDESYRKALKLDPGDFAATFDPVNLGLLDEFKNVLLEGHGSGQALNLDLHKLNVYGPGSFFKAHKDTPRGPDMLGSLVVVYPTRHVGGTLTFLHQGQELTFDSAGLLSASSKPSVAYAAFYGDVEHEVDVVESGYRVTLTYNIYLVDDANDYAPIAEVTLHDHALRASIRALLLDHKYLPNGGMIGFGLRHEYPITPWWKINEGDGECNDRSLQHLLRVMKGNDAVLVRTCEALGLSVSVRMVFQDTNSIVLLDEIPCMNDVHHDDWVIDAFRRNGLAKLLVDPASGKYDVRVYWATAMEPIHVDSGAMCMPCIVYGNEALLSCSYSKLCLIVEIGDAQSSPRNSPVVTD